MLLLAPALDPGAVPRHPVLARLRVVLILTSPGGHWPLNLGCVDTAGPHLDGHIAFILDFTGVVRFPEY